MPRFFINKEDALGDVLFIKGEDAYHIARSLRMAVGDSLVVSDGEGLEFICRLTRIRDEACECEIIERRMGEGESPVDITLFMAYPKGDKLETVIQKAVELGASRIVPFESSRCIKRPKAEKLDKQLLRLSRIAREAAGQSARSRLPRVLAPISFSEMIVAAGQSEIALFCYEGESCVSIKDALRKGQPSSISVIVGSEGGFSEDEAKMAREGGLISVSLGKRILRCETAPAFALSSIAYEFEI